MDAGRLPEKGARHRSPTFLWGSSQISEQTFDKPLILHIHNDTFGDNYHIRHPNVLETKHKIGTLKPGSASPLPVQTIWASTQHVAFRSTVTCTSTTSG